MDSIIMRCFGNKSLLDISNLKEEDINLIHIAYCLGYQCRWGGNTSHFYSVAQHSCLLSNLFSNKIEKLCALLHDASEAFSSDIPTPLKSYFTFSFKELENRIDTIILSSLNISPFSDGVINNIKLYDEKLLQSEEEQLVMGIPYNEEVHVVNFSKVSFWNPEVAPRWYLYEVNKFLDLCKI